MTDPLRIPNVKVSVSVPSNGPVTLGFSGGSLFPGETYFYPEAYEDDRKEAAKQLARLKNRDWRKLRAEFLKLDISDYERTEEWLISAGYYPSETLAQNKEAVLKILKQHQDAIAWLMKLEPEAFKKAIRAAHEFYNEQREVWGARIDAGSVLPNLVPPDKTFRRAVRSPSQLDPELLKAYLMGTGRAPLLLANFRWDSNGIPLVVVNVLDPLEAIGLSIHIDRNFSVRQWDTCAKCGIGYERQRGDGRFCSLRCKNYVATNTRRQKIKLLQQAVDAWSEKPDKASARDRWAWIAQWVKQQSEGEFNVEPDWAKKVLKQLETTKRRK